jgi:hypothetical protein
VRRLSSIFIVLETFLFKALSIRPLDLKDIKSSLLLIGVIVPPAKIPLL